MQLNNFQRTTDHLPAIPKRITLMFVLYFFLELRENVIAIRRGCFPHRNLCQFITHPKRSRTGFTVVNHIIVFVASASFEQYVGYIDGRNRLAFPKENLCFELELFKGWRTAPSVDIIKLSLIDRVNFGRKDHTFQQPLN